MANYKVVDAEQLDADLKTVADAIREGSGAEGELPFPDGMAAAAREKNNPSDGWCFAFEHTYRSDISFDFNGVTAYKVMDKVFSTDDFAGAYVMGWDNNTSDVAACYKAGGTNQSDWVLLYLHNSTLFSFPTAGVKSIFGLNNATVPESGTYIAFNNYGNLTDLLFKP